METLIGWGSINLIDLIAATKLWVGISIIFVIFRHNGALQHPNDLLSS